MRILACLFACTAIAAAQSLTTSFSSNFYLASLDGGVYFDLAVANELRLDQLDLDLCSMPGTPGHVDVWLRPGGWQGHTGSAGDWVSGGGGPLLSAGPGQPSVCVLSPAPVLPPGHYGIALHVRGVAPCYRSVVQPQTVANGDVALTGGGSSLRFLTGAPFCYRLFSGTLHYTTGGWTAGVARVDAVGEGCRRTARSFCESFAPGTFDLAGQRLVLTPNTIGGYDVARGPAGPIPVPAGALNLGLARSGAAFVPLPAPLPFPGGATSSLLVGADGCVRLSEQGLLGPLPAVPTEAALFAAQPTVAVAGGDFAPTGAANVWAQTDANGAVTIVWAGVPTYGASAGPGSTFSFVARPGGVLELAWGAVDDRSGVLVGFGAGLGARDPGGRDLTDGAGFTTEHDDAGLLLDAVGRPVLGTTVAFRLGGAPAGACGALLFGWRPLPGVDLASLGAPGCHLYLDPVAALAGGLVAPIGFATPPAGELLGVGFAAQGFAWPAPAGAFVSSNALGLVAGTI